jgi:multidrug transporter EmrE-like cation transporter
VTSGAFGQVLLKHGVSNPAFRSLLGANRFFEFILGAFMSPTVLGGLALYALSAVGWLFVLARTELSFAYPFLSVGFVITTVFGWMAFGESISASRILGISLIMVGVVFVARS